MRTLTPGSITTLTTNPIWTVQTAQAAHAVVVPKTYAEASDVEQAGTPVEGDSSVRRVKLGAMDAVQAILKKDGISGFWRGIGPALILVINPVIQVRLRAAARSVIAHDSTLRSSDSSLCS